MCQSIMARRQYVLKELPTHLKNLRTFCVKLTRNGAAIDDLVQSTCLRALERAAQFEPGTRLDKWICTIARSVWLNELRNLSRSPNDIVSIDLLEIPCQAPSPECRCFGSEIFKKICALPREEREAVWLMYVEGLSFQHVAAIMGISIGTVVKRLTVVRDKLSKATGHF